MSNSRNYLDSLYIALISILGLLELIRCGKTTPTPNFYKIKPCTSPLDILNHALLAANFKEVIYILEPIPTSCNSYFIFKGVLFYYIG